uniref:Tyrosine specific protein phosphatases domain-containing protein n=1 Tax=Auxenochlorella protothecoides TaxID=3075 RepID=A0A1D2A8L0_AUXPR
MEVTGRPDNADVWLTKADKEQRLSPPLTSVNLRDLCSVSDNIKPGMCVRSSQVISQEDAQRLGVRTVLDLRRSPVLCKAHPNNTGQLMKHTFFKGRIWFSGIAKCHVRLRPSKEPDHNRALSCQRCTAASKETYGQHCSVYHVDLLPTNVALNILGRLPHKLQFRVLVCAARQQTPEPIVAAAIANPDVMGYFKFYKILLEKARLPLARAVRLFADKDSAPVLVHCIHGKDRTGVVTMLLLLVCDVDPGAIVEDYVRSELILRESRDNNELVSLPGHLTTNEVIAAAASVIEALMDYMTRRWGGAKQYLVRAGLTVQELAAIRVNYMLSNQGQAAEEQHVSAALLASSGSHSGRHRKRA